MATEFEDEDFPSDWSAHRLRPTISAGLIYLADAAARAGSILAYPWEATDRLFEAGVTEAPRLPAPELAFGGNGHPVAAMHERFAVIIRRHAATGCFEPDPVADLDPTPVDADEWEDAYWEAEMRRSRRAAARTVAGVVAVVLAQAAADGHVATFKRPMSGTRFEAMTVDEWMLDEPLRRLAACAFNEARPNDPSAAADHYVFVDPRGFDAAVKAYVPTHFMHLMSELRGDPPPGAPAFDDLIGRVTQTLLEAVTADRSRQWRRPDLKEALGEFGILEDTIFEKARARVEGMVGPLARRWRPPAA